MSIAAESYAEKLSWAAEHLKKLERLTDSFADGHPYAVRHTVKKNKDLYHLIFTDAPDRRIPLIAGDFLYNLKAALDHMASALVPASRRSSVMFPVVREKVWELPYVEGEHPQRTKDRERWDSCVRGMRPEAVTRIQAAQPTELKARPGHLHYLDVLNRLRNRDTHDRLLAVAKGLGKPQIVFVLADGTEVVKFDAPGDALNDGAYIETPPATMDVKVSGTARVGIRFGQGNKSLIEIPATFWRMGEFVQELLVDLAPYVRRSS